MERRVFNGTVTQIAVEVSEWLGCDIGFILDSYVEGDFKRTRYFERLGAKHATLQVTE